MLINSLPWEYDTAPVLGKLIVLSVSSVCAALERVGGDTPCLRSVATAVSRRPMSMARSSGCALLEQP